MSLLQFVNCLSRSRRFGLLSLLLWYAPAYGQSPISVGSGSYAAFPPPAEGVDDFVYDRTLYIEEGIDRPVPTNDWWTDLIFSPFGGELWAYPMVVDPEPHGFEVRFPVGFNAGGNDMVRGPALTVGGMDFSPSEAKAADWSDWSVLARMRDEGRRLDATLVHGAPFVWFETSGLTPALGVPSEAVFSDGSGSPIDFPFTGSRFVVTAEGRNFGVHLPAGTTATLEQLSFLKIDLGTEQAFDTVYIHWEAAYAKAYEIQTSSDGDSWDTLESVANGDGGTDAFTGLRARARYLRLRLLEEGTQYPFSVWELEVFQDGELISQNAPASASSVQADHLPARATDGDRSTRWAADFGSSDTLALRLPRTDGYVVVSALPESEALEVFDRYARNVPRDTRLDYDYIVNEGRVSSRWTLETEHLDGAEAGDTLQGFIPHHYKNARTDIHFGPYDYITTRGALKLAAGRSFAFDYDFHGVPAHYTAPYADPGDASPFDSGIMNELIDRFAERDGYGGDTYWGGKDILNLARHTLMAKELGHEAYEELRLRTRTALTDWLTYTEGETEHYYAFYPRYKALVGFNESYGSGQFVDHHFHYGYLVHAVALYAMADPGFLDEYGGMARLVLREYADWRRDGEDDGMFPWLRTFDPWIGHSYAGGTSSPTGNNQESTSEAVQSWIGMFLLGNLLDDEAMRDAGAFGYLTESRATLEYWFDRDGENWPDSYDKSVVGILFNGGYSYGTFFSGSPVHIHGIQYLPVAPGFKYFAEDPAWALSEYQALMTEAAAIDGRTEEAQFGNDWAQVVLGMRLLWDAPYVTAKLQDYWDRDNGVLDDPVSAITYYFAHAQQNLGPPSYDHHTDLPISTVYLKDGRLTTTAYNPSAEPRTCTIYNAAGETIDRFELPPRSLVTHPDRKPVGWIIEAEDYLAYGDSTPENLGGAYRTDAVDIEPASGGGYNVGWITDGEWLEYEREVPQAGFYRVILSIASPFGGSRIAFHSDGERQGSAVVPDTGGWQAWQDRETIVELEDGRHTFRLRFEGGDVNLDRFAVRLLKDTSGYRKVTALAHGLGGIVIAPESALHPLGQELSLTPVPADGWSFEAWSGDAQGGAPLKLTVNHDLKLRAHFLPAGTVDFDSWAASHTAPDLRAATDDGIGNGRSNLLNYFLDTTSPESSAHPAIRKSDDGLRLEIPYNPDALDTGFRLLLSHDLVQWSPFDLPAEAIELAAGGEALRYDLSEVPDRASTFFKLKVHRIE